MTSHSVNCLCTEHLLSTARAFSAVHPQSVIYQSSLMSALLSGIYEGETTIAQLLEKGDFGLGTFNALDGELIAFDSQAWQLTESGQARPAHPDQKTPFAVMTFFHPHYERCFESPLSREAVHHEIDTVITSDNQFCALRIDGLFNSVDTRTVPHQNPPWRPMTEIFDSQPTFHFDQREGVLVGFRTPQFLQGIGVAGYHEHFITDDRQGGGHLLDYRLQRGVLRFGAISKLVIDMPQGSDFLTANLMPDNIDSAIRYVES
jgi:acetolactate decarboxylase